MSGEISFILQYFSKNRTLSTLYYSRGAFVNLLLFFSFSFIYPLTRYNVNVKISFNLCFFSFFGWDSTLLSKSLSIFFFLPLLLYLFFLFFEVGMGLNGKMKNFYRSLLFVPFFFLFLQTWITIGKFFFLWTSGNMNIAWNHFSKIASRSY